MFAPFSFTTGQRAPFETFADGFNPVTSTRPCYARRYPSPDWYSTGTDGSIFVTDDMGGSVWRIFYKSPAR